MYLQRIRKHGNTLADTVLPEKTSSDAPKDAARIGTSNDKSWAGWAISSFTNKLATADGEIEPTAGVVKPAEETTRSASVPRPTKSSSPAPSSLTKEARRTTAPLGRSVSAQPTPAPAYKDDPEPAEEFYDAWGAMDDEDEDGWGKDEDPFNAPATTNAPSRPKANPVPYDDGGEPDFAGWLAAQSKGKKPLPKGLNTSQSTITRTASPGTTTKAKVVVPAKKIDTKPKDEDEDDGWGDAWE
jgi:SCY1-like protein 1